MYIAYNYSPGAIYNSTINLHLSSGTELYNTHKQQVQESLSKYISDDGIIQGTELQKNWFPVNEVDVFLSHSHNDVNKVKAFAGWLKDKFNLNSFIDSCCWGYCNDLLKRIDKKYCYDKNTKTYNYNLRNYTTSHVHMMLATALTDVMKRSECVIFFNTPSSIIMKEELNTIKEDKPEQTTSPWILYELSLMTSIKKETPQRLREQLIHGTRDDLKIHYDTKDQLNQLLTLKDDHLIKLLKSYSENKYINPLDELYKITNAKGKL